LSSIVAVRDQVADWAAGFDASAYTVEQCQQIVSHATAMERMMGAVKAQAAARIAQTDAWKHTGARSAAHALADATGTTVGAARETLDTGTAMATLPALAQAARRGELSAAQSASVASVAAVAPELVPALITRASQTSLAEFREECGRTLAAREPDPDAKRAAIRDQRSLRTWADPTGARILQLKDAPDIIAGVMTAIAPAREALRAQARQRGETIRPDALDADALVATVHTGANGPTSGNDADGAQPLPHRCAPRAKILVRVDFDTLLRGYPIDGEICEIAGYGPIAVTAVTDIITSGDAFLAAIVTKGQQVLGVSHYGRKALAHQATALEWINPTCAVDGCTQHTRLETDHRDPWANTKLTLLDLLDRLCDHHHDLKTRKNWALTPGHGKRPFVPPTDPRHPNNSRGDPTQK
jgi:hypothetical protein